jgi:hypothetical protein
MRRSDASGKGLRRHPFLVPMVICHRIWKGKRKQNFRIHRQKEGCFFKKDDVSRLRKSAGQERVYQVLYLYARVGCACTLVPGMRDKAQLCP